MRWSFNRGLVSVAFLLLALVVVGRPAGAQTAIHLIGEPVEQNNFPDNLTFTLNLESSAEIREVRFRYTFLPENRSSSGVAQFDPGTRVKATFTIRSGSSQSYIPPGKSLRYSWEARDVNGATLSVPVRDTTFADTRFPWQAATDGLVTVNYYRGGQRDAEVMALVARETIEKAGALMGATFDFPMKIWAYASQRDFQIALAHESVSSDRGVLGQAHEPDTFIMVVDRLSSPSALDTARHELTHLVTARALAKGPYTGLYPSWLNEGTSVYSQVSPNDVGYIDSLEEAIQKDSLIAPKLLTAGTRNRNIGLFYGEGYALVKYLVDTFGAAKFAAMITAFNSGGVLDDAFTQTFGADSEGVYRRWRQSVGLNPERTAVDAAPAVAPAAGGSSSSDILLYAAGTLAMLLLLGAAVAGGLLLARRAQHGGS